MTHAPSSRGRDGSVLASPGTVTANKDLVGLRITIIAALVMLLAEMGLGFWIKQAVNLPAADDGSSLFVAIGRALSNGPVAVAVHAVIGLLLLATAVTTIIRAMIIGRMTVLVIGVIGLAAILGADVAGARFVGTGTDSASNSMLYAAILAIACYLAALIVAFRPGRRH